MHYKIIVIANEDLLTFNIYDTELVNGKRVVNNNFLKIN